MAGLADQMVRHGGAVVGADLAIRSNVPAGAGLSSSASLEIAAGLALAHVAGIEVGRRDLALCARHAEEEFVGVAVGIMDQFASALAVEGHALRIWCDTGETAQIPFAESVLIFDTAVGRSPAVGGVQRATRRGGERPRAPAPASSVIAHARRRDIREEVEAAELPPPLDRRARHVVTETRRVARVVAALERGECVPGAELLASHESLRKDYECAPELDWFVERAMRAPGVRGARLTGAGWGGCAIRRRRRRIAGECRPRDRPGISCSLSPDTRLARDGGRRWCFCTSLKPET